MRTSPHAAFTLILGALLASPCLHAANEPVIIQAESGTLGSGYQAGYAGVVGYLSVKPNLTPLPTSSPGVTTRVATYSVTFPAAGTYDIYVRVRAGGTSADSFFYGNGFGEKVVTDPVAWIRAEGLSAVGFTDQTEPVTSKGSLWTDGVAGTGIWKWLRLTGSQYYEQGIQLTVPEGQLTQTFQLGSREAGLDIDKIAFGVSGFHYTVAQLNNGTAGVAGDPPPPYTPPAGQLPLATGKSKFLGCCYSADSIPNFAAYFNQVTPGNGGKWGSVESSRDVMNWTDFDNAYRLAKTNGFKFRYHVLVWGSQQPSWIENLSDAEQLEEIKEWFAAVAAHTVDGEAINPDWIEVVNEPLHAAPDAPTRGNYAKALGGAGTTGWDWIINAFRLARQYFPEKKLMINEYSVTNDGNSAARYVQIINLLKAENLIDLVGFQGHSFSTKDYSTATLAANLETIAATGLPIIVTELDIDDTATKPQLADFQRIFPLFWEHPSIIGVTLWGYRPGMWRPDANLVTNSGVEKPAMLWLKDYVHNNLPVVISGQALVLPPGATNGAALGPVLATDADVGAILQDWSIKDGTAAAAFTINPATGQLTLTNAAALDFVANPSYTLRLKVGDGIGHSAATIVTIQQAAAPAFSTNPADVIALPGASASFAASATGAPLPTLRWQRSVDGGANWADLSDNGTYSGVTTDTLSIGATTTAMSGDRFRCVATGDGIEVVSAAAKLTVNLPYADWSALHGVTGGPDDDPSGCGVTNFARYAFNLAPSGPVGSPANLSLVSVVGENRLQISFTRQPAATGLAYIVEASANLVDWTEVDTLHPDLPAGVAVIDNTPVAGVSRRFLRIRVTSQL